MKVCIEPGCPKLTRGTRCLDHEAEYRERKNREYDAMRPGPAQRGYDQRHREWREKVLARDRFCACGCGGLATVADHIIPISEGGARFDLKNGQGMTEECHNRKRQEESVRARRRKKR